jgi:hypothetical protein
MSVKITAFAAVLVVQSSALAASDAPQRVPQNPPPLAALPAISAGEPVVAAWGKVKHHFTPEVKTAYLAFAKAEALRDLAKARHSLPVDFTAWVDSDPAVAATVYGIQRGRPAQVLAALRSLELDLGVEEVRQKHTQLALAIAVVDAPFVDLATMACPERGISLAPRTTKFQLKIPPSPLRKVNTHPTDRRLDMNDHIINFFEGRTITEDRVVTRTVNGKKVPTTEKWTHPLEACDVIASAALQREFNAYMKEHRQRVAVNCGNHVLTRDSRHRPATHQKEITAAYNLFLDAYKAKGLYPKAPDRPSTSSQTAAYLVRNDAFRFPAEDKREWPRFPLTAPWPVLVYLAADRLPLREREFIWKRFRDENIVERYGEYVGAIAFFPVFLEARRLRPMDFVYGTYPEMLKDGGVCSTCSSLGRRTDITFGIPARQAGQPGHSCFVVYSHTEKDGYNLRVVQSVSAKLDGTTILGGDLKLQWWVFSAAEPLNGHYAPYPLSIAYAVNYGFQEFLDGQLCLAFFDRLPHTLQRAHGLDLLMSSLAINPFNINVVEAMERAITSPQREVEFWKEFERRLDAVSKPGCPSKGFYRDMALKGLSACIATLPVPRDKTARDTVAAFLKENADAAWLKYELATMGLPRTKTRLEKDLTVSVTGPRTLESTTLLAARIKLVGAAIGNKEEKLAWGRVLVEILSGHETFTIHKGKRTLQRTDPCTSLVFHLAGKEVRKGP